MENQSSAQLASRFREVILNGTWIANTNFRHQLSDVTWEQANAKIGGFNTIAMLTFHIGYYIGGILNVFRGGDLEIRDRYSFDLPPMLSQEDWEVLTNKLWSDSEEFAYWVEKMPDSQLNAPFVNEKYGNYRRNIDAMIEHAYYHLGQVVLIKKLVTAN